MGGVTLSANPGAVLLKLGFGLSEDAIDPQFAWEEAALLKKSEELQAYCLRVFIFQARGPLHTPQRERRLETNNIFIGRFSVKNS